MVFSSGPQAVNDSIQRPRDCEQTEVTWAHRSALDFLLSHKSTSSASWIPEAKANQEVANALIEGYLKLITAIPATETSANIVHFKYRDDENEDDLGQFCLDVRVMDCLSLIGSIGRHSEKFIPQYLDELKEVIAKVQGQQIGRAAPSYLQKLFNVCRFEGSSTDEERADLTIKLARDGLNIRLWEQDRRHDLTSTVTSVLPQISQHFSGPAALSLLLFPEERN